MAGRRFRLGACFVMAAMALPAAAIAQIDARADTAPVLPNADSSDDIIVSALKIPREKLPVQVHWSYLTLFNSAIQQDSAAFFMRCAFRSVDPVRLSRAIDGPPNYASTRFAAYMIAATNTGCYRPRPVSLQSYAINQIGVPEDLIDHGVLFQQTLAKYAPDATLTVAQTYDPAISQRLFAAETVRNRYRLPNDLNAFKVSMCLVQRQPALATRLVHATTDPLLQRGLTQTLLVEGRECLGGVKQLNVDPAYMRAYVNEAFYRWIVAARGVRSLIPTGEG